MSHCEVRRKADTEAIHDLTRSVALLEFVCFAPVMDCAATKGVAFLAFSEQLTFASVVPP